MPVKKTKKSTNINGMVKSLSSQGKYCYITSLKNRHTHTHTPGCSHTPRWTSFPAAFLTIFLIIRCQISHQMDSSGGHQFWHIQHQIGCMVVWDSPHRDSHLWKDTLPRYERNMLLCSKNNDKKKKSIILTVAVFSSS